jgi:hypothetical protein
MVRTENGVVMTELLNVNTSEIKLGDIVHTHGMRVLMDREPVKSASWGAAAHAQNLTCYAWVGLVLNPEDVADSIPRDWIWTDGIGQPRTEPRWNVQGNELASWRVERP